MGRQPARLPARADHNAPQPKQPNLHPVSAVAAPPEDSPTRRTFSRRRDRGKSAGVRPVRWGRRRPPYGLYAAATSAARHSPGLKAVFDRLKAVGKERTVIVAVMRIRISLSISLLLDGRQWIPRPPGRASHKPWKTCGEPGRGVFHKPRNQLDSDHECSPATRREAPARRNREGFLFPGSPGGELPKDLNGHRARQSVSPSPRSQGRQRPRPQVPCRR